MHRIARIWEATFCYVDAVPDDFAEGVRQVVDRSSREILGCAVSKGKLQRACAQKFHLGGEDEFPRIALCFQLNHQVEQEFFVSLRIKVI